MSDQTHPEIVRLFSLLQTLTSNERWIFSPDLGGAEESGFAWEYLDHDNRIAGGKSLDSLLDCIGFNQGLDAESRWAMS